MLLGRYLYWSEVFKVVLFCNTADKKILSQSTFANNLVRFQMLAGIMEKYWEKSWNQSDHWVLTKYFIVFVFYESILIRNINIFTSKESVRPILANLNFQPIRKPVKIEIKINVRNSWTSITKWISTKFCKKIEKVALIS